MKKDFRIKFSLVQSKDHKKRDFHQNHFPFFELKDALVSKLFAKQVKLIFKHRR